MSLRALDDIKDSVRTAAHTLMRSTKGISLRLCDVSMTVPSEASMAVVRPSSLDPERGLLVRCPRAAPPVTPRRVPALCR